MCLLSAYKAGRRQQPEGLHWSPLWKWRCESLTEIVCSQLLALYATGADALTVCQLLAPLMYVFHISLCLPLQIVHSPTPLLSEMLNYMLTQLSTNPTSAGGGCASDDAATIVFRIYLCVLLKTCVTLKQNTYSLLFADFWSYCWPQTFKIPVVCFLHCVDTGCFPVCILYFLIIGWYSYIFYWMESLPWETFSPKGEQWCPRSFIMLICLIMQPHILWISQSAA